MRVLVVEDEQAMAESLRWGLEAEGYVVDTARNGEDGLWKACETGHDVILLDVMLPGPDGYQVCRQLRAQGMWTPILMLTAMVEDLDQAEGLDSGADDYLSKPLAYPVLLARLRALTRRALGERPVVLVAAGLCLDPASRTVKRGDVPLDLTSRDVAVLEYTCAARARSSRRPSCSSTAGIPPTTQTPRWSRFTSIGFAASSVRRRGGRRF